MGVATKHSLYAVEAGSSLIGGISDDNLALNPDVRAEALSGEVYARFIALYGMNPEGSFTTRAIAAALNIAGILGKDIGTLAGGLNLYGHQHAPGGTRTAGATHLKYNVLQGLLIPVSLSVAHQGDATLNCRIVVIHDGSANDPIIKTGSVALPAGIVDNEAFTLGKSTVGSFLIGQKTSMEINFGINVKTEASDSDIFPTFISIENVGPSLTINTTDLDIMNAAKIPQTGLVCTHANTIIHLRKRLAGGTFVADGTAEHIKFTADGIATVSEPRNASNADPAGATISLPLRYDGTNAPLTVDTASVIA